MRMTFMLGGLFIVLSGCEGVDNYARSVTNGAEIRLILEYMYAEEIERLQRADAPLPTFREWVVSSLRPRGEYARYVDDAVKDPSGRPPLSFAKWAVSSRGGE